MQLPSYALSLVACLRSLPMFFQAVSDLGMTWEDKEPKVLKSVDRLHPKLKKKYADFTARMLSFTIMVPNYLTLYLYRSLAAVERLTLQESHFNNFHNLAPLLCIALLFPA